jgi:hypothetical protein
MVVLGGVKGKYCFYEEDMIMYVAFNFWIISDKIILDLFYLSPRFLRDIGSRNFTSI